MDRRATVVDSIYAVRMPNLIAGHPHSPYHAPCSDNQAAASNGPMLTAPYPTHEQTSPAGHPPAPASSCGELSSTTALLQQPPPTLGPPPTTVELKPHGVGFCVRRRPRKASRTSWSPSPTAGIRPQHPETATPSALTPSPCPAWLLRTARLGNTAANRRSGRHERPLYDQRSDRHTEDRQSHEHDPARTTGWR